MEDKRKIQEQSGSGDLDYGHNKPTGGTSDNTGKINPQGPSSGTANYSPDKQRNQQTAAGTQGAGKPRETRARTSPRED
jgi:hypothetical protein